MILLPAPRKIELSGQADRLPDQGVIVLQAAAPQLLLKTAQFLQTALEQKAGLHWQMLAGSPLSEAGNQIVLILAPGSMAHEQGYSLHVLPGRIDVLAGTPAALFYAVQTLIQLVQQHGRDLPGLHLVDWPDFAQRGVMLDISRDRVPSMQTLYHLVDLFASWKINQLQLYTEHTFAYRRHPDVWAKASPLNGEEILALDAYCRERFIELVPNQNTFGHMTRWLTHDRYRPLAESPNGCDTRWGHYDEPISLCPTDPGSLDLVRSMLDELLPHFSSRQVNVGGDEPVDLDYAQGRSGDALRERGVGRVYLDYMLQIYNEVKARGHTMQMWGDIIMEHPDLTPELPRDLLALEWGYEADHPFDEHGALFAASGIPFYVCPGTSSWNAIAGRTDNAMRNLRSAALNGLKHGATGYLITDWGDNGHWQPLPVSYPGFAYGAALSWACQANLELDLPQALNAYVFQDESQVMGRLAYEMGNIYLAPGMTMHNGSALFYAMQSDLERLRENLPPEDRPVIKQAIQNTLKCIDQTLAPLDGANMQRSDGQLIQDEYRWVAQMLRHACWRILWTLGKLSGQEDLGLRERLVNEIQALSDEHRKLWMARSRAGGFAESVARLEKVGEAYLS